MRDWVRTRAMPMPVQALTTRTAKPVVNIGPAVATRYGKPRPAIAPHSSSGDAFGNRRQLLDGTDAESEHGDSQARFPEVLRGTGPPADRHDGDEQRDSAGKKDGCVSRVRHRSSPCRLTRGRERPGPALSTTYRSVSFTALSLP